MIKGVGVDNVDIFRLNKVYEKWGEKFISKIFSIEEIPSYKDKKSFLNSLAGKFAAKEAIAKALGNGFRDGLTFKSIKIIKSLSGKPVAIVQNRSDEIMISITHTDKVATAIAIINSD